MADDEKKSKLRPTLFEAGKVLVPKDRIVTSSQGCWNCLHVDRDKAKELWTVKRQNDLARALAIAQESPQGEDDQRVKNIRRMVDNLDHMVAAKQVGVCTGGGVTENGEPVGDFVKLAFLCRRWTAAPGASLARDPGAPLDPLPGERLDKLKN